MTRAIIVSLGSIGGAIRLLALSIIGGLVIGSDVETISLKLDPPTDVASGQTEHLKRLASGVGREFEPTDETTARLGEIGIRAIRCIHVEPKGAFASDGSFVIADASSLDTHLEMCRRLGAKAHIVMGMREGVPDELRASSATPGIFGPTDWTRYQAFCEALFAHVLLAPNRPAAYFEVGNEPDIDGLTPSPAAAGSADAYQAYLTLYENVCAAAARFEQRHPGSTVILDGPGLAWVFTFRFGDFNWSTRFLRDCAQENLRLDFFSIHYYGNLSSLAGSYASVYPSFSEMFAQTREARDAYRPGVPILLSEWGPTGVTSNAAPSVINGTNLGAAWCMEFLDTALRSGVEDALFLVTTDLRQANAGVPENVWGWPALFVNPTVFHGAFPKAPFHVFTMISRLRGERIPTATDGAVRCFASASLTDRHLSMILWNYDAQLPENGPAIDRSTPRSLSIRVRGTEAFFGSGIVRAKRWLVSEQSSNAYGTFIAEGVVDARSELQLVDDRSCPIRDGEIAYEAEMPQSSVAFVEMDIVAGTTGAGTGTNGARTGSTSADAIAGSVDTGGSAQVSHCGLGFGIAGSALALSLLLMRMVKNSRARSG